MSSVYLFSGPCGCGKSTLAEAYAKHLVNDCGQQQVYLIHGDDFHASFVETDHNEALFVNGQAANKLEWEEILRFNWECILDVTEKVPRILRAGLVTREMIAATVGDCLIAEHKEGDKIKSPGVKYGHYMPKCLTARFSEGEIDRAILYYDYCLQNNQKPVFLCEDKIAVALSDKNKLNLGATPEEVAFNLYDKLREGEKIADIIIAIEPENSGGVYDGILNRLNKSCKKL